MWKNVIVVLGLARFVKHVCLPKGSPYAVGVYVAALVALAVLQWLCVKKQRLAAAREYLNKGWDTVHEHIVNTFGEPERVWSIKDEEDETVFVIPPSPERNFITLVTFGKWAHSMDVPDEYTGKYASHAEFLITLPPDWSQEKLKWSARLLRIVANMPSIENSWFCPGHTLSFEQEDTLTADTEQTGILLLTPNHIAPQDATISLPYDEKLTFLQLVLLYPEEMEFLHRQPLGTIPPEIEQLPRVVDLHRPRIPLPPPN